MNSDEREHPPARVVKRRLYAKTDVRAARSAATDRNGSNERELSLLLEELFEPLSEQNGAKRRKNGDGRDSGRDDLSEMLDFYAEHFADEDVPAWREAREAGIGGTPLAWEA